MTSSMHNMFGASVSEVYIIWCQFDLKIDNLILMIGEKKRNEWLYMPGKSTIIILEKMSEVIADGYLVAALSKEVCSSCWKQGGEGHKYPSVVNSLIGAPPMVGHIRV